MEYQMRVCVTPVSFSLYQNENGEWRKKRRSLLCSFAAVDSANYLLEAVLSLRCLSSSLILSVELCRDKTRPGSWLHTDLQLYFFSLLRQIVYSVCSTEPPLIKISIDGSAAMDKPVCPWSVSSERRQEILSEEQWGKAFISDVWSND